MAKSDLKRVLLDSSALIAWIRGEPAAQRIAGLIEMIDREEALLVESVIVLAEVYKRSTAPDEAERIRQDGTLDRIRAKLESRDVMLLDVTPPVARKVTELRRAHKLKLPDATHLATALLNKCDWLVTLDSDFPQLDGLRVFRMELLDASASLPWDVPVQAELFDVPGNVISLPVRTPGEV